MRRTSIKVCVDRLLPMDLLAEAADRAIEENPANKPVSTTELGLGVSPFELALITAKKWENGRTLRVRFLDGHSAIQAKVERHAQEWSQHANIKFRFGSDPNAEIRISFDREGSWSWIGADALSIPANEPTINFGWLTLKSSDEDYRSVVLHEFGHALGCIHEHQNPAGGIQWNKKAVYRYYAGKPNYWSREKVDYNLFRRYSQDITQFSAFDPGSIMLYPIAKEHTLDGLEVGLNSQLSATDIAFICSQYPFDQ